ncbi:hypothetical protein KM043_009913 [Ampulex compressa]|nr:hypothetical protein KM043_009913 [Ampulex compressa]
MNHAYLASGAHRADKPGAHCCNKCIAVPPCSLVGADSAALLHRCRPLSRAAYVTQRSYVAPPSAPARTPCQCKTVHRPKWNEADDNAIWHDTPHRNGRMTPPTLA